MGVPELQIKNIYILKNKQTNQPPKNQNKIGKICGSAGEGLGERGGHPLCGQEDGDAGAVAAQCAHRSVCTGG